MHILDKFKIMVGPVLIDAAQDHFNVSGVPIRCFLLPGFMYTKLSQESGFVQTETRTLGEWKGFQIIRRDSLPYPLMREHGDNAAYRVFYERNLRTKP